MKDEGGKMKALSNKWRSKHGTKSETDLSRSPDFILHPSSFILFRHPSSFILVIAALAFLFNFTTSSSAQRQRAPRIGAHSTSRHESFTPSDRLMVERAIGATCAERIRDPIGSTPIDEMQS